MRRKFENKLYFKNEVNSSDSFHESSNRYTKAQFTIGISKFSLRYSSNFLFAITSAPSVASRGPDFQRNTVTGLASAPDRRIKAK
jgi:ABC-type transport system involved in Fe-S cluster assembly fused permease/ATPase subunit